MGQTPAPMLADYGTLIEEGLVTVAEFDGLIVGLIVLMPKPDHLYVDNIAVSPDRQGSGIGAALLAFADRQATEAGLDEIRLYTNEVMTANISYYPRRGFIETHRAVEDGYRRIYYSRPIDDS